MKIIYCFLLVILATACKSNAQHPFKYDNSVYNVVSWNQAFRLMDSTPGYLLLDVRSAGEYADTCQYTSLNIGRIQGARNLTIDSFSAHLAELKPYANKPILLYCSHSQRSRRFSKLLAENGFTNIYNINGGMSVLNESDEKAIPLKTKKLVTHTYYANIASTAAIKLLETTPDLAIIDIRTPAEFQNQDSNQSNNLGRLKYAINIPQQGFESSFDSHHIKANGPVLLYDLYGYNSMDVVDILKAKGFTRIYNLYEGLAPLVADHSLSAKERKMLFEDVPPYNLLDTRSAIELLTDYPNTLVLDARPTEEFNNQAKMDHMNLGRLKGSIHIDSPGDLEKITAQVSSSTPILVYGPGTNLDAAICTALVQRGFKDVNKLGTSLYQFVWSTANIEDCKEGRKLLVDHDGLY